MHDDIHRQLNAYSIGINVAGIAIDLLVYKKPTKKIPFTPLQRLGAKSGGRAAIAAGLAAFYASNDYLTSGSPPIGLQLALETPRFIGKYNSAPLCRR
jgi:uncharacterized membrane protein